MKQDKLRKLEHRLKCQVNTRLTVLPKYPNAGKVLTAPEFTPSRPLMVSRLVQEVKEDFKEKKVEGTRQERRGRMMKLARKAMKMIRVQGHKA